MLKKRMMHPLPSFKIIVVFFLLSLTGFLVLPQLSVRLNPSDRMSSISLNFEWPNADPYHLEQEVTAKIEAGMSTLQGIESIRSKSAYGQGSITLDFDQYVNLNQARFEVANVIRQLYPALPASLRYPSISVNRPDDDEEQSFLTYTINAPEAPISIQQKVKKQIEPYLAAIEGIDRIMIHGAEPKEFVIRYRDERLRRFNLDRQQINQVIQNYFAQSELGTLSHQGHSISLSLQPEQSNLHWHIPISKIGERIIYLNDIASIREKEQAPRRYYRINGNNAITITLFAKTDVNTIILAKEVEKQVQDLSKFLPENYQVIQAYNATNYLSQELNKIYNRTAYTVVLLFLFILLVSRSFSYLLISLLSLSANIAIAFLLYYLVGIEIQLYSLAGITISLGLMIDNSIMMIDHLRNRGNRRIFIPLLAATLTTVGALISIYFLEDTYRLNLIDFALVIVINLSVSLAIALWLIPALVEKTNWSSKQKIKEKQVFSTGFYRAYAWCISLFLRFRKTASLGLLLAFGLPLFLLPEQIASPQNSWEIVYNKTIGSDWYKTSLRPYADRYLGGAFRLFSIYVLDEAYYGSNEETKLHIHATMEKGASIQQMNEVMLSTETFLNQFAEIKQYITNISSGEDGQITVTFRAQHQNNDFPYILRSSLNRQAIDLGGIQWRIYGVGKAFSNQSVYTDQLNFSVKAKGYNFADLNVWAQRLKTELEVHPRVQKTIITNPETFHKKPAYAYQFQMEKENVALYQLNPSKVFQELKSLSLSKQPEAAIAINGQYLPIRFESNQSNEYDLWHLRNYPIDSLHRPINLKNVLKIRKELETESIYKKNQEYLRQIDFSYTGSAKSGYQYLDETLARFAEQVPLGFSFEPDVSSGYFKKEQKKAYGLLLLLIIGVVFLICSILFENLLQPLILLALIPISFIGVFLCFYVFDLNFDQGGIASFVLLTGLTVNAAIFILNEFNYLKKAYPQEKEIDIYLRAFQRKLFPILLTTFSTILGFIPFLKDGQQEVFWFALGAGTIGGLLFSMLGIFIYLPIFALRKQS